MTADERHKRIWTEIAEAFDTSPKKRSKRRVKLTYYGLCYAYRIVTRGQHVPIWPDAWTSPLSTYIAVCRTAHGDRLRATFAGLFAAMSKREWEETLRDRAKDA